ncbi:MAG TPA: GDP-mannose 4,6-dehydratase [Roseiflexaceae bacterium]|nr:GDP-mannose 4,6-dehydratase [Roseiflexaceae bacterium]
MRAFITGINGFVGGYLAEALLAEGGWEVWGFARQPQLALPNLRDQVRLVQGDLADRPAITGALRECRPEVIFHLAGQSNVPRSFQNPAETLHTNIFSELYLFEALLELKHNPVVLITGSNEIYGQVRPDELPVGEQTPLRPVNPYAVSKAAQDLLAFQYHIAHKLRTIRLRPFNHIGPRQGENFVASAFAAQIARIEAGLQEPRLRVGNLAAERDFTDVRDIVQAYILAATHGEPGAAYNIGAGHAVSIRWLLDTLIGHSSASIEVETDPARMRPADVPRVVCDARFFHAHTGWEPHIPLTHTLADILNYWRAVVTSSEV